MVNWTVLCFRVLRLVVRTFEREREGGGGREGERERECVCVLLKINLRV